MSTSLISLHELEFQRSVLLSAKYFEKYRKIHLTVTWSRKGKIEIFVNGILQTTWNRSRKSAQDMITAAGSTKLILGKALEAHKTLQPNFKIKYHSLKLHDERLRKKRILYNYKQSRDFGSSGLLVANLKHES